MTQSESSHSKPTNGYHRRAAFLNHKTNNMESPSPKKARIDGQSEEGTVLTEQTPLTGEENSSHGTKRKLPNTDNEDYGGNASDTGSVTDHALPAVITGQAT